MILKTFSPLGCESWDVERQPLIREGMPVLIDDDLLFEDAGVPRASTYANRWLRELPLNGAPAQRTWKIYAEVLQAWMEFLTKVGVSLFDERKPLQDALSSYAERRLAGPLDVRLEQSTWNLHMNVLSAFYGWAVNERHATAVPFSYAHGRRLADGVLREFKRNLAKVRAPKPHTTIKYLEKDFSDLFLKALVGLDPDGDRDRSYNGRELGRNAAMGRLVLASGPRRQEFTHLLRYEVPPLPNRPNGVPVPFPLPGKITKGSKTRTSWIPYEDLVQVHEYIDLERSLAVDGSRWRPMGEPLHVENPDWEGGWINDQRRRWSSLTKAERLRLVAPDGGTCLLGVKSDGGPFIDWATVFRRTSLRVRERFEPRFPIVAPHRCRHTFAMQTLERLVGGFYQQAARLVKDTDANAALALYLTKADPLMVLRDLLGHSSVLTTELYLMRLDVTRIYAAAYRDAAALAGLNAGGAAKEADREFDDEEGI